MTMKKFIPMSFVIVSTLFLSNCEQVETMIFGPNNRSKLITAITDSTAMVLGSRGSGTFVMSIDVSGNYEIIDAEIVISGRAHGWGILNSDDEIIFANSYSISSLTDSGVLSWNSPRRGHTISRGNNGEIFLVDDSQTSVLNSSGDLIRSFDFGGSEGSGVIQDSPELLILESSNILSYTLDGTLLTTCPLNTEGSDSTYYPQIVKVLPFGDYWLVGKCEYNTEIALYIQKRSPSGDILFETHYEPDSTFAILSLAYDGQEGLYLGISGTSGAPAFSGEIIKFSPSGVFLWSALFSGDRSHNYPNAIAIMEDGSIMVAGDTRTYPPEDNYPLVGYYSSTGELIWMEQFNSHDFE